MNSSEIRLVVLALAAIVIVALGVSRTLRQRPFRATGLWRGPVLVLVGIILYMRTQPFPTLVHGTALAAALTLGWAIGWVRAKLVRITIDPATGDVIQQGSPYGLLLILGLFALRWSIGYLAPQHPEWGIDLKSVTDVLLVFALGHLSGYAAELHVAAGRARRMPGRLA